MIATIELPLTEWHHIYLGANSDWENIVDYVLNYLSSQPTKNKIAFMLIGDGLITSIAHLRDVVEHLNTYEFALVIGSMPSISTFEIYDQVVKERSWANIPLVVQNAWEHQSAFFITNEHDILFDTTPRVKDKLLLSFNGEARPERGFILASLIRDNLFERSYVSAYHNLDSYNKLWSNDGNDPYLASGLTIELIDVLNDNKHMFPIELSRKNYRTVDSNSYHPIDDVEYFNNSYFSLVNETVFYDRLFLGSGHIPTLFLTEKTYKVIAARHPFIIAQRPGILKALRDDGYKTFHPYIDETYDTIENDVDRLHAIYNEVLRLSEYTDEQWLEFQHNVRSIVEHNFMLLKTRKKVIFKTKWSDNNVG